MKRGEVHWVEFSDVGTSSEVQKTRPAIVITVDTAIARLPRVQVVPLTTKTGRLYPGDVLVTVRGRLNKAMGSQVMTVDKARLLGYWDTLPAADLESVEKTLRGHLGL